MMTRTTRTDRGAALVEFAMILPILILLVFGVIEFGRGYHTKSTLTHAARESVRVAALDSGDPVSTARNAAPNLNAGAITVTVSSDPCTLGDPVTVTLEYDHIYDIPLFGSGTWSFAEQGVMRCGG
jgi:Flp pilus assembly protein TadG